MIALVPSRARRDGTTTNIDAVVKGDYCVGCGGCAAIENSMAAMRMDARAVYQPTLPEAAFAEPFAAMARQVCPFLDEGPHEDALAAGYAGADATFDAKLGWHRGLYAGHARTGEFRARGSSGGLTSWLLTELLRRGEIDGVIEVRQRGADEAMPRFSYAVAGDEGAVQAYAKTRYYPIEISEVAALVRSRPGRYAFVGVPCFVKTMRRLAAVDPVIAERVTFFVGIVCGHLKSGRFGESLAWQMGVPPDEIAAMDFRHKIVDRPASRYGFAVTSRSGEVRTAAMSELAGHDWGMGMFRLKACDYCDDVVGETADVSFGDAWLPRYVNESAGTNLVVARHPLAVELLEAGSSAGAIALEPVTAADIVRSQDASFRHRRDGLAYRLHLDDKAGRWRPLKRVEADAAGISLAQKLIFRFRMRVSRESHKAYLRARRRGRIDLYVRFVRRSAAINARLVKLARRYAGLVAKFSL